MPLTLARVIRNRTSLETNIIASAPSLTFSEPAARPSHHLRAAVMIMTSNLSCLCRADFLNCTELFAGEVPQAISCPARLQKNGTLSFLAHYSRSPCLTGVNDPTWLRGRAVMAQYEVSRHSAIIYKMQTIVEVQILVSVRRQIIHTA